MDSPKIDSRPRAPSKIAQLRDVVWTPDHSKRFRVLLRGNTRSWVIEIDPTWSSLPEPMETEFLDELARTKPPSESNFPRTITPKMRKRSLKRFGRIRKVVVGNKDRELFTQSGRVAAFKALQFDDPKLTYWTFLRLVRAWFYGGCVPEEMLPDWDKSAHTEKIDINALPNIPFAKAAKQAFLYATTLCVPPPDDVGFNPQTKRHTLFRVQAETLVVFKKYYEWKNKVRGRTLENAFVLMLGEVFSSPDPLGNRKVLEAVRIPSQMQFDFWYRALYSHDQRRRANAGDRTVDLSERALQADEISGITHAGERASIDATVWNVYIRNRLLQREVIGPPIVFRIRSKGGMLLGIGVSLENANWISAASAIACCLENKVKLCAGFGITITPDAWPIKGLPGSIEADGGETKNTLVNRFIDKTNCHLRNMPAHRPDMRGGSESDWNTLQVFMNGTTAGAMVGQWQKRTGTDWKIQGTMDIEQFTRELLEHELARMKKPRKDINLTPAQIEAGVDGSPLAMWNWSVQNEGASLMQFDLADVELSLMPIANASIRADGVFFKGVLYTCESLEKSDAFMKVRRAGRNKTHAVAFDPRLADVIFLYTPDRNTVYTPCRLNIRIDAQREFAGKSFAEINRLLEQDARNRQSRSQESLQERVDFLKDRLERADDAEEQTQAVASNASKTAQKMGIRERRTDERASHSPKTAFSVVQTAANAPAQSEATAQPAATRTGQSEVAVADEEADDFENTMKRFV